MPVEGWGGIEAQVTVALGAHDLAVEISTTSRAVAVVGPSGAGKSTLLRVIAGVEPRARGRLVVDGRTWLDSERGHEVPPWERRVGWVPQNDLLFPHLSVRENLEYAAPPGEALKDVARLLEVDRLLERRPRNLSGGERQRVALGRALLFRPRLLLLDEPFAALDRALRAEVAQRVREWTERNQVPLVLVSHDEEDAVALAHERWSLQEGRLERV